MQTATITIQPRSRYRYKPTRVCIPIGMACNAKCRYCMRLAGKVREPRGLSPLMRGFLKQLDPATTEAVVINGGEPLLYIDRIKEVFSLVPPEIHRCVMTNGKLLTQEFVDYLNSIDGELHFSHEGTAAKALKGFDVLDDPKIVGLLNQVHTMRLYTIVTALNPDVLESYEYIASKLDKVQLLWFTPFPMFAFVGSNGDLQKGFDYARYGRSIVEMWMKHPDAVGRSPHHARYVRNSGFVVMPNGDVSSLCTLRKYGTVLNSREELVAEARRVGEFDYCDHAECSCRRYCSMAPQLANDFTCSALRMHLKALEYMRGLDA